MAFLADSACSMGCILGFLGCMLGALLELGSWRLEAFCRCFGFGASELPEGGFSNRGLTAPVEKLMSLYFIPLPFGGLPLSLKGCGGLFELKNTACNFSYSFSSILQTVAGLRLLGFRVRTISF